MIGQFFPLPNLMTNFRISPERVVTGAYQKIATKEELSGGIPPVDFQRHTWNLGREYAIIGYNLDTHVATKWTKSNTLYYWNVISQHISSWSEHKLWLKNNMRLFDINPNSFFERMKRIVFKILNFFFHGNGKFETGNKLKIVEYGIALLST